MPNNLMQMAWSSVGRKVLMALTGLGLALFVVIHLLGNLLILVGAEAFNSYAYFLEHLGHGAFIYIADAGLLAFFLIHAASGIEVYRGKRRARAQGYELPGDAGGASKKSFASLSMIITGPIILLFVILHVIHFKFGPGMEDAARYVFPYEGKEIRHLYLLVVEAFQNPVIVIGYVAVMLMLGLHLQHGVWSGFQSLGWTNRKVLPVLVSVSWVLGVLLALGFVYIPIHVFAFLDPETVAQAASPTLVGGH
jgi:succinate dehydrogenase / fumarate reductase cytochrome b subunit